VEDETTKEPAVPPHSPSPENVTEKQIVSVPEKPPLSSTESVVGQPKTTIVPIVKDLQDSFLSLKKSVDELKDVFVQLNEGIKKSQSTEKIAKSQENKKVAVSDELTTLKQELEEIKKSLIIGKDDVRDEPENKKVQKSQSPFDIFSNLVPVARRG
jgi:hypothetical protein